MSCSDRDTTEESCSYEWVREYNYSVHNAEDHRTYWFQFADGRVTYTDLNTKLSLAKRGKHGSQDIPVPSGVCSPESSAFKSPESVFAFSMQSHSCCGKTAECEHGFKLLQVNFKRRLENEAEQDARKKRLLDLTGEAGDDH